MVMISFGVNRELTGEPHIHAYFLDKPFRVGAREVSALLLRTFNYSGEFAPPGMTVIQATFDSDWDWWAGLSADKPAYESQKRRVAESVRLMVGTRYDANSSLRRTNACR